MEFIFPSLFSIFALSFILTEHGHKRSSVIDYNGELVQPGTPLLFNPEVMNWTDSDVSTK